MTDTSPRQAVRCESCGAAPAVRLRDGSNWCGPCDQSARNLGYDDGTTDLLACLTEARSQVDYWTAEVARLEREAQQ